MIDYGLAKKYMDNNMKHVVYSDGKNLTGTVRYASINMHVGIIPTRRDDLESLGYMLIYFLQGRLPWQGIQAQTKDVKYQKIAQSKISSAVPNLIKGFPREFGIYLEYCRSLLFDEVPDYVYLKKLFVDLFFQNNYVFDFDWDWMSHKLEIITETNEPKVKPLNHLDQYDPWFNVGHVSLLLNEKEVKCNSGLIESRNGFQKQSTNNHTNSTNNIKRILHNTNNTNNTKREIGQ